MVDVFPPHLIIKMNFVHLDTHALKIRLCGTKNDSKNRIWMFKMTYTNVVITRDSFERISGALRQSIVKLHCKIIEKFGFFEKICHYF